MTHQLPQNRGPGPHYTPNPKRPAQVVCAGGFLLPGDNVGLVTDPRNRLAHLLLPESERLPAPLRTPHSQGASPLPHRG
jgi:hypothetical protein